MSKLLSPREVQHMYDLDRPALDNLEKSGKLSPVRTTGGHRRYDSDVVSKLVEKATPKSGMLTEFGSSGLSKWDDTAYREPLRELKGSAGYKVLREMRLNDPVISAVFFALVNALRQANWRVKSASDKPADKKVAEFVESCFPAGTMITLRDGTRMPIEDIKIGDEVLTHTGNIKRVYKTINLPFNGFFINTKVQGIIEEIQATSDHLFLVCRPPKYFNELRGLHGDSYADDSLQYSWVPTSNLRCGDFLVEPCPKYFELADSIPTYIRPMGIGKRKPSGRRPSGKKELFQDGISISKEMCRLIGYYLAEGSLSSGTIFFYFHEDETEYIMDVLELMETIFGVKGVVSKNGNDSKGIRIIFNARVAYYFFEILGRNARKKRLPLWLVQLPKDYLMELLCGLIRGDGCFCENGISFTTASEHLANQVRFILSKTGTSCYMRYVKPRTSIKKSGEEIRGAGAYTIEIGGKTGKNLGRQIFGRNYSVTTRAKEHNRLFIANGFIHHKIQMVNIEKADNTIVYNLDVEDDNSFVANSLAVHNCIGDFSWSFSDQLTFIVDPLFEQGFSYLEQTFKYRRGENAPKGGAKSLFDDNKIGWRKWAPRPAESLIEGDEWVYDANGGILGANQEVEGKGKTFLPIEKCLLFRTTVHPANSPWGLPIHRSMFTSYYYSQNIAEIEGIGVERDLAGIPVVYLGTDCSMKGPNSEYELAKDLVVNIRNDEQTGVVIPKPKMGNTANPGEGMLLELLNSGGSREFDTSKIIERYDKRKAVSVLAQFILLGMDRMGSYALSKNQSDLFVLAAGAWLLDIAGVINRHAIPQLVQFNAFPRRSGYPELVPGTIGIPDLVALSEYVNRLVQATVLTPDNELERHLRQIGGLPAMSINLSEAPRAAPKPKETVPSNEENTAVKKAGHVGYRFSDRAQKDLEELWDGFSERVKEVPYDDSDRGALIAAAIALLIYDVEKVLKADIQAVWMGVRGDMAGAGAFVDGVRSEYMGYFRDFMVQVQTQLKEVLLDVGAYLESLKARAGSYCGAVWRLYNEAKLWRASPDSLWEWRGPNDERTCVGCRAEIEAGSRPLRDIHNRPGTLECLSNCRCELFPVNAIC